MSNWYNRTDRQKNAHPLNTKENRIKEAKRGYEDGKSRLGYTYGHSAKLDRICPQLDLAYKIGWNSGRMQKYPQDYFNGGICLA